MHQSQLDNIRWQTNNYRNGSLNVECLNLATEQINKPMEANDSLLGHYKKKRSQSNMHVPYFLTHQKQLYHVLLPSKMNWLFPHLKNSPPPIHLEAGYVEVLFLTRQKT